ncbi:MAG: ELWxxDGT repeat protein, partial [Saprospiraceae bacterium]
MLRIYAFYFLLFLLPAIAFSQTPELVADLNAAGNGFDQFKTTFLTIGSKTVVVADNGLTGFELYVLENNSLSLLKDIFPNLTSSQPASFALVNDKIYFAANDSLHGRELWVTDGTTAGTTLAYDLTPGPDSGNPINLTASESGRLFFEKDHKLYTLTTGSAPVLLSAPPYVTLSPDFNSVGAKVVPFKNGIAFVAQDGANPSFNQIWTSDGTPGGTLKVKSYPATFYRGMHGLMALADKVVFTIDNAFAPADTINGLYASNGLSSGTVKLVA